MPRCGGPGSWGGLATVGVERPTGPGFSRALTSAATKLRALASASTRIGLLLLPGLLALAPSLTVARGEVVHETTSPFHHIRVVDADGVRTLSFDGSMETRMSLQDPLKGHFEYTEYFHLAWLWHTQLTNVLMVGLGGASAQRAFAHHYPDVTVETAELDAQVLRVAREYFHFKESPRQRVFLSDGRVFLRRTQKQYDVILMDAYTQNRYGSFIPAQLATQEFFELASQRLATNGVLAYNVMGTFHGWKADVLGAIYKTMKSVFPQVYLFPATDSQNVVLIGTKSPRKFTLAELQQRAAALLKDGRVTLPSFRLRLLAYRFDPPPSFQTSPVLTDDFAPIEGLLRTQE